MSNCVEDFGEIKQQEINLVVGVHRFKNFINKKYQLCLTGKTWPESMLVWINNIILI